MGGPLGAGEKRLERTPLVGWKSTRAWPSSAAPSMTVYQVPDDRMPDKRSPALPLRPIARDPRLSDKVATTLMDLIVSGQIGVGQMLPTERDLSSQLGVSRTVVREAT